jgi:hypothetical protein
MTYNPKNANPFQAVNTFPEWTGNELLLKDPQMRRKAGVTALDADVSEMFNVKVNVNSPQQGGAAYGAPFYLSKFGSATTQPYGQGVMPAWVRAPMPVHKPAVQQTGGMQMASHYYNNTHRW